MPAPNDRRKIGDCSRRPPEMTIPQMLRATVARCEDKPALQHKAEGAYQPTSYGELATRVRNLALGFAGLGLEHGARVALLSENRPEWAVVDLAAVCSGLVNTPLYSTLPPAQVEYIVADCEAEVLVASNDKQLAKVIAIRERLPKLKYVLVMDPPASLPEGVLTLADVEGRGAATADADAAFQRLSDAVKPGDLATIIYTSGTTGQPKGAMLTHDNFMSNAQAAADLFNIPPDCRFLSFLPLSHVFERLAGHYFPLLAGATIAYAESVFTVASNLAEVKPNVMSSVPRLYESFQSRVQDGMAKQPEKKQKAAQWAMKVGWEYNSRRIRGESPGLITSLQYALAEKTVLKAVRDKITGGELLFFISGGAPLPVETGRFMISLGVNIIEGYGLTETSPVISFNPPGRIRLGTVGIPIEGVEVMIAEDGEILSRGPHIMQGYFNKPEDTAQAINSEGWFHTGDIGIITDEGYLKITDRKKDIIVLANGKNVAPQPIENTLKGSPYIANVVLFGDRQPNVVALVVPDLEHLKKWAKEKGLDTKHAEELVQTAEVKKFYKAELDRYSKDLADFEKIRRFTLIPRDFSQERDELTPTLKIKRRVVAEHYAAEIQGMLRD